MSEISEQLRRKVFRGPTMEASHTTTLEWQAADEIDRLRAQDEAIRAEFGGKRDGRPTIECVREAFAAKWSAEDTLFQATLDMKTKELRAEIERLRAGGCARDQKTTQYCAEAARLAAENEKISALRATCNCGGLETGNHFSDCPYALALETPRRAIEIIELRARVSELDEKADRLAAENEKLRAALQEAFEVYAGSDGFIPETAAEGYQQEIIKQIMECINSGLTALQDKSDVPTEAK